MDESVLSASSRCSVPSREMPAVSADHRKPVVAFVVLAFAAAAVVGIQRADAHAGRLLAAVIGTSVQVQGALPLDAPSPGEAERASAFGPAFGSLDRALQGDPSEPLRVVLPAEKRQAAEVTPPAAAPQAAAPEKAASATAVAGGQGHSRSATGRPSPVANDRAANDRDARGHQGDRPQQAASGRQTARPEQARMMSQRTADDLPAAGRAASRGALHRPGQRAWTRPGFTASDRSSR